MKMVLQIFIFLSSEINECWKITVDKAMEEPEKYGIHVEIHALEFEDPYISGECNGDFLEIREGKQRNYITGLAPINTQYK